MPKLDDAAGIPVTLQTRSLAPERHRPGINFFSNFAQGRVIADRRLTHDPKRVYAETGRVGVGRLVQRARSASAIPARRRYCQEFVRPVQDLLIITTDTPQTLPQSWY